MATKGGMNGQWLGTYTGSSNGRIIVNIDELESNYVGVAYAIDANTELPTSAVSFETESKGSEFHLHTQLIQAIDPVTASVVTQIRPCRVS